MESKHQGRYFFIDTNPSNQVPSIPSQDNKGYESDIIDEELEHRLYSLVHHSSEAVPGCNTTQRIDTAKSFISPSKPVKKQAPDDSIVSASKRRKSSPSVLKKADTIDPPPSSSSSTTNLQVQVDANYNSTIYLSDSDEDNGGSEVNIVDDQRDLWHIDYKDILIANPIHGKFYRPKIWCSRCRKEGNHPVKLCHLPKNKICYICGEIGHLGQHCKNQHCKRCMDFHPTSKCSLNVRDFQCRICSKYGHLDDNCPNHWRKFFSITDPSVEPDPANHKILKNKKKSCSVCGRHQHYSFECDRLRQRHIEISSPYDVNTTFGGNFHPNKTKSPASSHQTLQPSELTTSGRKYRRPRYFSSNNQDVVTLDSGTNPQISNKNNRKKSKNERRNKKKKAGRQFDDSVQIINGPSIRSGRVDKNKTRQQQKKRNRKAGKNLGNSDFMIGFRR